MRTLITCCLVSSGLAGVASASAADTARAEADRSLAALTTAANEDDLDAALDLFIKTQIQVAIGLRTMLGERPLKERAVRICYVLGFCRANSAVEELSKWITLEVPSGKSFRRYPRWVRYPAQEALVRIGVPAIRHMILNLETSDDEKVRYLSARTILEIMRGTARDLTIGKQFARVILSNAADSQEDPEKKRRLQEALKYFK